MEKALQLIGFLSHKTAAAVTEISEAVAVKMGPNPILMIHTDDKSKLSPWLRDVAVVQCDQYHWLPCNLFNILSLPSLLLSGENEPLNYRGFLILVIHGIDEFGNYYLNKNAFQ